MTSTGLQATNRYLRQPVHFGNNANRNYLELSLKNSKRGYGAYSYPAISRPPDAHIQDTIRQFVRPGEKILELGCNAGANLLPLAEAGYKTFGVDISGSGIDALEEAAQEADIDGLVEAEQYDFVENGDLPPEWTEKYGDLKGSFKAIYAVHTLSHLTPAKLVETMRKMKEYLAPGGVFIVSIIDADKKGAARRCVKNFPSTSDNDIGGYIEHSRETVRQAFRELKPLKAFSRRFNKRNDKLFYILPFHALRWEVFQKP